MEYVLAALAIIVSGHVILYKRDARSALGWIAVILLAPIAGAVWYVLFGINRIQRRATRLRLKKSRGAIHHKVIAHGLEENSLPVLRQNPNLRALLHLGDRINPNALTAGNSVKPLHGGDEAYPAMLAAINGAKKSIALGAYIFHDDRTGKRFVDALSEAMERGVAVRVLVDDVGCLKSLPDLDYSFQRAHVPFARFLPTWLPWRTQFLNMRNHQKLLLVDGAVAFTGGMNISDGHWLSLKPSWPVQDFMFRVEGPVVFQLMESFAQDWHFTIDEALEGPTWFPGQTIAGDVAARSVPDGPDGPVRRTRWHILGAINAAQSSITIITPYFVPDEGLLTALNGAALRGTAVDIIIPQHNDVRVVHWAMMAQLWQILNHGCRVWLSAEPFDHTKVMIVDKAWTMLGSSNIDHRSLRLNFELNMECFDEAFGKTMAAHAEKIKNSAKELTLELVDGRPLWQRLRDGTARLFSPLL